MALFWINKLDEITQRATVKAIVEALFMYNIRWEVDINDTLW